MNDRESTYRFVVYEADRAWTRWTDHCVRQADHVLMVGDAHSSPAPGELERHLVERWQRAHPPRRSLALVREGDGEPAGTEAWLRERPGVGHLHLRTGNPLDFRRLARTLTGRGIGLVLGGGGARGFAHVGVLRAIQELSIPVDLVGGTSIGSIIGAAHAMGMPWRDVLENVRRHFESLFDFTLPLVSILAGRKVARELRAAFGERRIEELGIPFFCVSTNLTRAMETVHDRGSVVSALRASISLPGVFPPVASNGDLLVDGGLLNNIPIDVMAETSSGGPVLAVDVSPEVDIGASEVVPTEISGFQVLWHWLNPLTKSKIDLPSIPHVLTRTALISSIASGRNKHAEKTASLYLKLPVEDWKILEFSALDEIVERGYQASIGPLSEWWERNRAELAG
jgi:predicted acylesterase/phospholipase RssA